MKQLFSGTCLAVVCAVGLSAQGAGQPPAPAAKDDKAVTATGCLRAGDQPNTFVLSNVKWEGKTDASGAATSGSSGASASEKPTVRLTGSTAATQLSEHIGHTVQVTGKIEGAGSVAGTAGSGTGAVAGTSGSGSSAKPSGPSLNVESVKMISNRCDGQ